ncbi:MAG: alanine dehydrogenase [Flavihumibacter sp.]
MAQQKPIISGSFSYETLEETLDIKPTGAQLQIGIPRESSLQENRVALIPDAVGLLVSNGQQVMIEHNAGDAAHFRDKDYSEAGAKIVYDKAEVYKCPILVKSAPIMEEELPYLQFNQIIISPLHSAMLKASLLEKLMEKKITAISFEQLKDENGTFPIVRSMSEIAGSSVMLIAGQYLGSANHGKGVLLGGMTGIPPSKVIILGAGIVGEYAARAAMAMGASVKVFDNSVYRLKQLLSQYFGLYHAGPQPLADIILQLQTCEVAVGTLRSNSGRTPLVVTEEMVSNMRPGSVIIDVSIDSGGCFETSELTSHEQPIFIKYGVIHYCVPNIPSGFARTASHAISNVLTPLLLEAAEEGGIEKLIWHRVHLRSGIYLFKGALTHFHLSQRFNLKYTDLNLLIASRR